MDARDNLVARDHDLEFGQREPLLLLCRRLDASVGGSRLGRPWGRRGALGGLRVRLRFVLGFRTALLNKGALLRRARRGRPRLSPSVLRRNALLTLPAQRRRRAGPYKVQLV